MNRLFLAASSAVVVACILACGGVGTTGSDTSKGSDSQRVTMAKYNSIKNGMSYSDVVRIIGANGEEMSSNNIEGGGAMPSIETVMYQWVNSDGTNMNAMFQNDKLMSKAQFGLK